MTIPVDFVLGLVTKKAKGPATAVAILGIVILFLDLILILPASILYRKIPWVGTLGLEITAQLNISTVQYVMLLPLGALLYQLYLIVKKGPRLDLGLLFFVLVIAPIFGSITCSCAFWVLGGARFGAMEEIGRDIVALSAIADIEGSSWKSWGFFEDLMRASFPFFSPGAGIASIALNAYTFLASLYFSFTVWRRYHGESGVEAVNPRLARWNPPGLSRSSKILSFLGFLSLGTIAALCIAQAISGYASQSRILEKGVEVLALVDAEDQSGNPSSIRWLRVAYSPLQGADGEPSPSRISVMKAVEYPFYTLFRSRERRVAIKYDPRSPEDFLFLYSKIYKLSAAHDNDYAGFLRRAIMGLGFLFAALWCFPLMWMDFGKGAEAKGMGGDDIAPESTR